MFYQIYFTEHKIEEGQMLAIAMGLMLSLVGVVLWFCIGRRGGMIITLVVCILSMVNIVFCDVYLNKKVYDLLPKKEELYATKSIALIKDQNPEPGLLLFQGKDKYLIFVSESENSARWIEVPRDKAMIIENITTASPSKPVVKYYFKYCDGFWKYLMLYGESRIEIHLPKNYKFYKLHE